MECGGKTHLRVPPHQAGAEADRRQQVPRRGGAPGELQDASHEDQGLSAGGEGGVATIVATSCGNYTGAGEEYTIERHHY